MPDISGKIKYNGKQEVSMDETTKKIRDNVYMRVRNTPQDEDILYELLNLYMQFQLLDMLDSIDSRLISLENEVSKQNPLYK